MLYNKIQPQSFLGSGEEFTFTYTGMAAMILFNGAKLFEQILNTLSTEGPMWNLVKIARAVSEKEISKIYIILYMHIAQGQGQITTRGHNFNCI